MTAPKEELFYCTEKGLTKLAYLINQIRDYEPSFNVNGFLQFIDGSENYLLVTTNKFDPEEFRFSIDEMRAFQRIGNAVTIFGYLSGFMIEKAVDFVNNLDELEKNYFNEAMTAFNRMYGDIQANFIWISKRDMKDAAEAMEEDVPKECYDLTTEMISRCDAYEGYLGKEGITIIDVTKSQVETIKNFSILQGILYANAFVSPEAADLLLLELNPETRNMAIGILSKYCRKRRVEIRKAKQNAEMEAKETTETETGKLDPKDIL